MGILEEYTSVLNRYVLVLIKYGSVEKKYIMEEYEIHLIYNIFWDSILFIALCDLEFMENILPHPLKYLDYKICH